MEPDLVPPPGLSTGAQPPAAPPAASAAPASHLAPHLRIVVLMYGVVAVFAVGFALFSGAASRLLGDQAPNPAELLAGLAVGGILAAATLLGERAWGPFARATKALTEMLGPVSVREALILASASGVAEELLFRGALWPSLGFWGSSLLFGLVHVVPKRALWIYPLYAAGAGFVLGLLRETTGSVFPPMIAHVTVNAVGLWWIGRRARAATPPPPPVAPA